MIESNSIYVVEDNETMRLGIVESLRREKYQVTGFDNAVAALEKFRQKPAPIVIADLKMEPMDGLELLGQIKNIAPDTQVLMISAYGSVEVAVEAMQNGAADFLTKPFSPDELRIRVKNLVERLRQNKKIETLEEQNLLLQQDLGSHFQELIGHSKPMQEVFAVIEKVAKEETSILIKGESGTGKELVARAIHNRSPRKDKPFIRVNCGALNENLLESELFGHEKGAFTGAIKQKKGRFELAHEGTLFLDEIGDISPAMQIKLLRVLQEKEFERVGGEETLRVDVRIISATNQNLEQLMEAGKFREDLYYRLSVIPVKLPSLRERKEDIPLLANHFLNIFARETKKLNYQIDPAGIELLKQYPWPGNIRELENLIERLVVISPQPKINADLIGRHVGRAVTRFETSDNLPLEDALYQFEKNLIQQALKDAEGVKNKAAKRLGLKTSTLYYKMEKFGLLK
jgi:two-component system response regulator HydG